MNFRKSELASVFIIILSFIIGSYFYGKVPDFVASHWGLEGNVNGYMPKFWGMYLIPLVSLGMFFLFIIIPRIDPLKKNIQEFRSYYDGFILLILIFLFYVYTLSIAWNLKIKFSMTQMLVPALAVLFYYSGILIEKAKPNWFIGIRTPWTLSNEVVWTKTHRIGGTLFKVCAVIVMLGIEFPKISFYLVAFPIILVSIFLFVYSYYLYKKEIN